MATITAQPTTCEPEDMDRVNDRGSYELVHGRLVEQPVSMLACVIATRLGRLLAEWADRTGLGIAVVENLCQCFAHEPKMVRKPDVHYISYERLGTREITHGNLRQVPELMVEVISPGNDAYELDEKIHDYFKAGVLRVWTINPDLRTLRMHWPDGRSQELAVDRELGDEQLLPGFRCPLKAIFPE